jgi:hypothetical protein
MKLKKSELCKMIKEEIHRMNESTKKEITDVLDSVYGGSKKLKIIKLSKTELKFTASIMVDTDIQKIEDRLNVIFSNEVFTFNGPEVSKGVNNYEYTFKIKKSK